MIGGMASTQPAGPDTVDTGRCTRARANSIPSTTCVLSTVGDTHESDSGQKATAVNSDIFISRISDCSYRLKINDDLTAQRKKTLRDRVIKEHVNYMFIDFRLNRPCDVVFTTHNLDKWKNVLFKHYDQKIKKVKNIPYGEQMVVKVGNEEHPLSFNMYRTTARVMVQSSSPSLLEEFIEQFPKLRDQALTEEEELCLPGLVVQLPPEPVCKDDESWADIDSELSLSLSGNDANDTIVKTPRTVKRVRRTVRKTDSPSRCHDVSQTLMSINDAIHEMQGTLQILKGDMNNNAVSMNDKLVRMEQSFQKEIGRTAKTLEGKLEAVKEGVDLEVQRVYDQMDSAKKTVKLDLKRTKDNLSVEMADIKRNVEEQIEKRAEKTSSLEKRLNKLESRLDIFQKDWNTRKSDTYTFPSDGDSRSTNVADRNSPVPSGAPSHTKSTLHNSDDSQDRFTNVRRGKPVKKGGTVLFLGSNALKAGSGRICPGIKCKVIRCYTARYGLHILENPHFEDPNTIIICCGTNDLDSDINEGYETIVEFIKKCSRDYPRTQIIVSGILPRKDLNVRDINVELRKTLAEVSPNVTFCPHNNISRNDLVNVKHLDESGLNTYAENLRQCIGNIGIKLGNIPANVSKKTVKKFPDDSNRSTMKPMEQYDQVRGQNLSPNPVSAPGQSDRLRDNQGGPFSPYPMAAPPPPSPPPPFHLYYPYNMPMPMPWMRPVQPGPWMNMPPPLHPMHSG